MYQISHLHATCRCFSKYCVFTWQRMSVRFNFLREIIFSICFFVNLITHYCFCFVIYDLYLYCYCLSLLLFKHVHTSHIHTCVYMRVCEWYKTCMRTLKSSKGQWIFQFPVFWIFYSIFRNLVLIHFSLLAEKNKF